MSVTPLRLSYYPWITQHVTVEQLRSRIEAFARVLEIELRRIVGHARPILVQEPVAVPEQIRMIVNGESDIALMNPLGYAFARRQEPAVEAISIALRVIDGKEGDTYFAQLYTHIETAIAHGLGEKDLQPQDPRWAEIKSRVIGRTVAFGSKQSTSNFLMPAFMLWSEGIHPFTAFKAAHFIGGHETAARAVYLREMDIGAGHDGVIFDLSRQYGFGDAQQKLIRFARVTIKSDPVVARVSDAPLLAALKRALVDASKTPEGRAAVAGFWGGVTGLAPVTADAYDSLLSAVTSLGLREQDMMG